VFMANGAAAGQRAPHFMIHIIPRIEGDTVPLNVIGKQASEKELDEVKKKLTPKIEELFSAKVKEPVVLDREAEKIGKKKEEERREEKAKEAEEKKIKEEKKGKKAKKKEEAEKEIGLDDIAKILGVQ
jgi:hypothetical protein